MRPVRSRVTAAIVLALLMVGSLASVANGDELSTGGFTLAPADAQPVLVSSFGDSSAGDWVPPTSFPEDPWPGLGAQITSFPEDPWPGLSN